jgi:endonuclease/exonuclease/phosphatase (EEP) superfamily protein YafD
MSGLPRGQRMRRASTIALYAAGGFLLAVTALPLLPSNERFIRIWDFPRAQIATMLVVVLLLSIAAHGARRRAMVWHGMLLLALLYQGYRMLPFTPLFPAEVARAQASHTQPGRGRMADPAAASADSDTRCARDSRISLMVANVRQSNRMSDPLLRLVDRFSPDLLLLVETDDWWARQLAHLQHAYPMMLSQPQDDTYGMMLFSRLPLIAPEVRFLLHDYVPSIRTGVRLKSGTEITFYGVHPKPPPLQDTERRDAELLLIAREVHDDTRASIVAGDLNDVAWSDTTMLLKKIGRLRDPRVGRALYSTYNAEWPLLRWPLDHVFLEGSFMLLRILRLSPIGSDHFPFFVALCHAPLSVRWHQQTADPEPDEQRRARAQIREGREAARDAE